MTTVVCDDAALAAQTGDIVTLSNIKISDELSEYLLRLAIVNNQHNVVQLLLELPYVLNFVCTSYRQPIMTLSIRYSSLDMVNSLVTIKCDIGAKHIIYDAVESGRPIEFINGLLVSSTPEIAPYMTYENVIVGEQNGIQGGICNVVYYKHILSAGKINMAYKLLRNKDIPLI